MCKAWEAMPQITIAAMEKLAVGAGVAIALACDWRVLGRSAYLYVPEVKIGLNLQWGALPRLITLVGPARAKRITIMCEKMPAAQALEWGLIDEVADDGRTVAKAMEMAEVVLSMPQPTVRMIKEAINATANALPAASAFADADRVKSRQAIGRPKRRGNRFGRNRSQAGFPCSKARRFLTPFKGPAIASASANST